MAENLPHRPTTPAAPMAATEWQGIVPDRVRNSFPGAKFQSYLDQHWMECEPASVPALLLHLRDSEQFDMLVDLTAVDRPSDPERFEIIYILYSFSKNERVRLKTRVAIEGEVPSATAVFVGANWLEREVFDMFGVRFSGHPGLKRILMPEDWTGHPLRKEKSIVDMDDAWVQRNLGIESGQ